jgi:hypothetical protein
MKRSDEEKKAIHYPCFRLFSEIVQGSRVPVIEKNENALLASS